MPEFATKSYNAHAATYAKRDIGEEVEFYDGWLDKGTTDVWRHRRMFATIQPLLKHDAKAEWVTIADGRFGLAAQYIESQGPSAVATDIDNTFLNVAKEKEWLSGVQMENAEKLSMADESFDFAYCKDAFHHFPRPFIAVYEMLRISKNAIALTEPAEFVPRPPLGAFLQRLKHAIYGILGKKLPHTDTGCYEPVGNYIYCVSEREIEKIALGLNLPAVAFYRFQDTYIKGGEVEMMNQNGPIQKAIKKADRKSKLLSILGIRRANYITAIVFKKMPNNDLQKSLRSVGFDIRVLPKNPFIGD